MNKKRNNKKVSKSKKENAKFIRELHGCQKTTKNIWKDNPILKQYEKLHLI